MIYFGLWAILPWGSNRWVLIFKKQDGQRNYILYDNTSTIEAKWQHENELFQASRNANNQRS